MQCSLQDKNGKLPCIGRMMFYQVLFSEKEDLFGVKIYRYQIISKLKPPSYWVIKNARHNFKK
jgi:hypothetical protein